MKILFLSKRQHTHKDLIDDLYGYARELPLGLAKLGHEVTGLCLSYKKKLEGHTIDFDKKMVFSECGTVKNTGTN